MAQFFQYDRGVTGETLYAFLRPLGLETIWNGSAFEAYNVAHWTTYAITMTEQADTGSYFGTWPSTLMVGWYDFTVYSQGDTSPVAGDTAVGSGPLYFTPSSTPVPPTSPSFSGTWYAHPASELALDAQTFNMNQDTLTMAMSFENIPEIADGETLSTCVVTETGGFVTVASYGNNETTGWAVLSRVAAGTATVTFSVTLSGGDAYVRNAPMVVNV